MDSKHPALPQGGFEYIQQPILSSYQAYGSAVNEVRNQPGNGVRGAPPQQAMHQTGAPYFQQPGQNMRGQHHQHGQYFISQNNNLRQQRPHNPAQNHGQGVVYYQGHPNNVVFAAAAPPSLYQSRQISYYPQVHPQSPYPLYIAPNGANPSWVTAPSRQQVGQSNPPEKRERKIIEIKDPNTGKDLTNEIKEMSIVNSAGHAQAEGDTDTTVNSGSQIAKMFTRMVAEKINTPAEESAQPGSIEGQQGDDAIQGVPSNQQYQSALPPSQPNQQPPLMPMAGSQHIMRPGGMNPVGPPPRGPPPSHIGMPPRPGMMSQQQPGQHGTQPSGTTPHTSEMPNQPQMNYLTRPPPQIPIRTPLPVYQNAQQQHPIMHQQPQQAVHQMPQQPMRHPNMPVMQPPVQHQHIQPSQPQHPSLMHQQQVPSQTESQTVPTASHVPSSSPDVVQSASNEKMDSSAKPTPETVPEATPISKAVEPIASITDVQPSSEASEKDDSVSDVEPANVAETKEDLAGASNKASKDARKVKKRNINTKEIVGSDMDAFIDERQDLSISTGPQTTYAPLNLSNECTPSTSNASQSVDRSGAAGDEASKSSEKLQDNEPLLEERLDKAEETDEKINDQVISKESLKPVEVSSQVEPKHKFKKKKKKKGRKSPPLSKPKQGLMSNGITEDKDSDPNGSSGKQQLPPPSESDQTSDKGASEPLTVKENDSAAAACSTEAPEDEKAPETEPLESAESEPKVSLVSEQTPTGPPEEPVIQHPAVSEDTKPETVHLTSPVQNQSSPPDANKELTKVGADVSKEIPTEVTGSTGTPAQRTVENKVDQFTPESPVNDENASPSERGKDDPGAPEKMDDDDELVSKATETSDAPTKKEGKEKLIYDRAYLMELRDCASSQTKPEGLPNLEIILDRPMNRNVSGPSPDFTPTFFQPSTPQRHPPQMSKSASRGRGGRPGENLMPQRIIKSVSLQNDAKVLHQSEKPWKPSQKQLASGEISNKVENLESKALFIMNRLTPTNFEPLSKEMMDLKIPDYEQLQQLVKIIFDKVTLETKFVEAYARLCKKMTAIKVPPPPGMKENQATFRVLLLTKCQTEFESDKAVVFEDPEEKRKKLEAETPEGPEKKDQIEQVLYHMKLRRLKFYGNIRFIGELFKLNMLTENIMHDCIFRLLKARDDESLLSLCQLISTVGQLLDTDKAKARMDQYFTQMTKIAEERKSRIKFTLKDAIELRSNNWVPRKEQTGPKKIDEVRQDFQQEQQTKQFLQSQPPPLREQQPGSRRGSRQRQEQEKPNDDGWNTVGAKSMRLDASKLKFSKNVVDDNVQLGPGGGMNKFSSWGRGSGQSQAQQDSPANRAGNRYSALTSDEDRRNLQRSPVRSDGGSIASRGMRQGNTAGHGRGKIIGRSSKEGERRDALASARSIVGGRSQNSSRDNSWNREDRRSLGPRGSGERDTMGPPRTISLRPSVERAQPVVAQAGSAGSVKRAAPKTEEEMEHSAKTIMDEYLNIHDLKEAKLCIMELEGQRHLHIFITASINNVLERSDRDRKTTGQFFAEIMKDNLISLEKYVQGLAEVLPFAEDMVIDIPKMWTNLAQLITPALVEGCMQWSQLKSTIEPHLTQECSAKLVAEIVLIARSLVSDADVAKMWQSSGISWDAFMPADKVAGFIQDKKLEFLEGSTNTSSEDTSQRTEDELVKILKESQSSDDIHNFVANISREMEVKPFVRVLMTAFSRASLGANMKFNQDVIKTRQDVLQKYIKGPELELQALFAIQALMHRLEHPRNVISEVFESLYNEEVINEEAFKQWEVSTEEPEGKGPCSVAVRRFLTWLRENDEEAS